MLARVLMVTAAVAAMCVFAAATRAGDDHAPVFDKRPYAEAKKGAEDGKKWLIVKATASWCPPCKRMDKTTWRDEGVVKWLKANAVAVMVDVDEQEQIARDLGIQSMPTMVAFKDGKEFDRVTGYKSPAEFLGWLEGMAKGEKSIEVVRKRAVAPAGDGKTVDVRAKLELARSLTESGKFEEAADEFVWLWKNMLEHDRGFYGVRLSYMVRDMQQLASRSEAAKKKFVGLRDETGKRIDGEKVEVDDVVDYFGLNRALDDDTASLAWYDRVKDQKRYASVIKRVERDLAGLLIEKGRWADVGKLYADPLDELENEHRLMQMIPKYEPPADLGAEMRKQIMEMPATQFREKAANMYAGLLAAGREEDAAKIASKARSLDTKPAMTVALVERALEAKQARKGQVEWLKGDDFRALKPQVEAALKQAEKK